MNPRREAAAALLGCLLGATLILFAASRPWAEGQAVQGSLRAPLDVSGGSLAPAVPALALAAMAGALAVVASRGLVRAAVGVAVLLCGVGVGTLSLQGLSPASSTLADRAGDALGTATATADGGGTAWPWVALVGGLLVAAAGAAAAWRGRSWPAMSARYENPVPDEPAGRERTTDGDVPLEQWRAMDRGEDPTLR